MVTLSTKISNLKDGQVVPGLNALLDMSHRVVLGQDGTARLRLEGYLDGDISVQEIAQKLLSVNPVYDWDSSTISEGRLQRVLDFDTLWGRVKVICDDAAQLNPSTGIPKPAYKGVTNKNPIDIIRGDDNSDRAAIFTFPVKGLLVHAPVKGRTTLSENITVNDCMKEWKEKYGYKITNQVIKVVPTGARGVNPVDGVWLTRESVEKIFDEVKEKNRKETRFVRPSQEVGADFLKPKPAGMPSPVRPFMEFCANNCLDMRKQCAITVVGGVSVASVAFLALKALGFTFFPSAIGAVAAVSLAAFAYEACCGGLSLCLTGALISAPMPH